MYVNSGNVVTNTDLRTKIEKTHVIIWLNAKNQNSNVQVTNNVNNKSYNRCNALLYF